MPPLSAKLLSQPTRRGCWRSAKPRLRLWGTPVQASGASKPASASCRVCVCLHSQSFVLFYSLQPRWHRRVCVCARAERTAAREAQVAANAAAATAARKARAAELGDAQVSVCCTRPQAAM